VPIVKALIADGADLNRFRTQMRLSIFPDHVATKLMEAEAQGAVSYGAIFSSLRDWNFGREFRSRLIESVEAGKEVTNDSIKRLTEEARNNPNPEDSKRTKGAKVEATETDLAAAEALRVSADRIDRLIPKDQPIVLLGRDAWPVLPLLKARGRDVQYFMWSRLQNGDTATAKQWLKEVPPHAAVIDTGFSGTILKVIKEVDPLLADTYSLAHLQISRKYSAGGLIPK